MKLTDNRRRTMILTTFLLVLLATGSTMANVFLPYQHIIGGQRPALVEIPVLQRVAHPPPQPPPRLPLQFQHQFSQQQTFHQHQQLPAAHPQSLAAQARQGQAQQDTTLQLEPPPDEFVNVNSEERQLELLALGGGLVLGGIVGNIIFPATATTTTTTTTTTQATSGSVSSSGSSTSVSSDGTIITTTFVENTGSSSSSSSGESSSGGIFTEENEDVAIISVDDDSSEDDENILKDFPGCGIKRGPTRIIGGTEIRKNEYPWLCSLQFRRDSLDSYTHICGCTLLSGPPRDTIIVGAAHCFDPTDSPSQYQVVCGEHHLDNEDGTEVRMRVKQVVVHAKYQSVSSTGRDIAIYKVDDSGLKDQMQPGVIYPACLPDPEDSYYTSILSAAGWGVTATKLIRGQKVRVNGLSKVARHVEVLGKICKDPGFNKYPEGIICASDIGKDSCQGDSGGPLMAQKDGQRSERLALVGNNVRNCHLVRTCEYSNFTLGIVSFGVGCADENYPGAYTRVSCFVDWIARQFGLSAKSTSSSSSWSTSCPGQSEPDRIYDDDPYGAGGHL